MFHDATFHTWLGFRKSDTCTTTLSSSIWVRIQTHRKLKSFLQTHFLLKFIELTENENYFEQTSSIAKNYVQENTGATKQVLNLIAEILPRN